MSAPPRTENSLSVFSIIRNCRTMGYPIEAHIEQHLDLGDEYVALDVQSDDGTPEMLLARFGADPRFRLCRERLRPDELVDQWKVRVSDRQFEHCRGRWILFLDGDEFIHERHFPNIRRGLARADLHTIFTFEYRHFAGSFRSRVVSSTHWRYKAILWPNTSFLTARDSVDAASIYPRAPQPVFRYADLDIIVFHYSWVRPLDKLNLRRGSAWLGHEKHPKLQRWSELFGPHFRPMEYQGEHPRVVRQRPELFDFDSGECLKSRVMMPQEVKSAHELSLHGAPTTPR